MSPATGPCAGLGFGPAVGLFNMKIRIIRMWTILRSSACCWPETAIRPTRTSIARAREWIVGMQSKGGGRFDGGWGAFEPENTHLHLNHIPFADHGALLDPPTSDVTARCVSFLAQIGMAADDPVMARALAFLRREQEADGSWFGRWGTNYIYGTWSVLCALNAVGLDHDDAGDPARRGLAAVGAARRRRLGRGRGNLSRRSARPLQRKHAQSNRMGRAGADGGGRDGPSGGGARHRVSDRDAPRGRRVDRTAL